MQPSRFVILTGHLKDYPLSDLVGILRHQRKTGRLLIEYPKGPASFYFRDGELVDAQLDNLTGLQAVCVAVAQPASSFNFNPLINPPKRSIENSMQRVVSEILGCWDENGIEIEAMTPGRSAAQPAFAVQMAPQPALLAAAPSISFSQTRRTDQALVFSSVALEVPKPDYSRPLLAMAAVGLMLLGISSVIALTGRFGSGVAPASAPPNTTQRNVVGPEKVVSPEKKDAVQPVAAPEALAVSTEVSRPGSHAAAVASNRKTNAPRSGPEKSEPAATTNRAREVAAEKTEPARENSAKPQPVRVIVRIENGRVAQASIANHKPGMDSVEALALRIARQRRYPGKNSGPETVVIQVTPSN
ncbi:MAG: DUF4388 domain-containing protein [Pyrinomonadaceae bacterium]